MTTPDLTPGQRQPTDPESNCECKRYKATETDDESTLIDDCDIADITDLDDEGFRLVRHRKERTVGIPVIITPVTERAALKKVSLIVLSTEIQKILGAAPVRSRFTSEGALRLDVQIEEHVNALPLPVFVNIAGPSQLQVNLRDCNLSTSAQFVPAKHLYY